MNRAATQRRLAKSAAPRIISHRAGTKAEAVHRYVRINRNRPGVEVVAEIKKAYKLTPATARNWYQTFKGSIPDCSPAAAKH